jgi:hypothetical protein
MTAKFIIKTTALFFSLSLIIHAGRNSDTTYYISPSGNDLNPGTQALPWKTIQKAGNSAIPGSTVLVADGVYNEAVTINVSGTATAGEIKFINAPGAAPIIDGSGLTVPADLGGLIVINSKNYISIKGFELRNYKTTTSGRVPMGINIVGTSHHIGIYNNRIHHIEHNGTSSSGTDAHGIAAYGTSGAQSINNIIIDGNELYNLKLGSSESLVMNGNVEQFVISRNVIHDNNNIGIDAIGFEGTAPANDQARNGIITGNTVYNIESYGNVAYGTDRSADGIYVDGGKDIVIERNKVHHCNIGIEVASEHKGKATSGVVVRSNLIWLCGVAGIAFGGYDTQRGRTENCRFINNTLYANDTLLWETGDLMMQYYCKNNVFANNIIYANKQNVFISNPFTADTGNVFDYNLYYYLPNSIYAASFNFEWMKKKYATFAAYKAATGNDLHSKFADPIFTNLSLPDLHLLSASPAINAGIMWDSIGVYDYDGNPRVFGLPDIGAYEYQFSVGIEEAPASVITSYALSQNYPNPFNPSTTISYKIPKSGFVSLFVYDALGREVQTLVNEEKTQGKYSVEFKASNLPSGVYFYTLRAGEFISIRKMIVVK